MCIRDRLRLCRFHLELNAAEYQPWKVLHITFRLTVLCVRYGVPLKTDKNITEWNIPKSSKEEVYNFIIEDLKYALDNCPDKKRYLGRADFLSDV